MDELMRLGCISHIEARRRRQMTGYLGTKGTTEQALRVMDLLSEFDPYQKAEILSVAHQLVELENRRGMHEQQRLERLAAAREAA